MTSTVQEADLAAATREMFLGHGRSGASSDAFSELLAVVFDRHFPDLVATVGLTGTCGISDPEFELVADTLSGAVLTLGRPERIAVAARGGDDSVVLLVDADQPSVQLEPVAGMDPSLGLWRSRFNATSGAMIATGAAARAWWQDTTAWGRVALGWQIVGGARAALEQATSHAHARTQFGRPIGTFQAVQHRLAEVLVAIEGAESLLALTDDPIDPLAAATAKGLAGRAYDAAARNCLQVLGGIGFTTEHPFDGILRRGFCLDQLLGSRAELSLAIGHDLLARRSVPVLCNL
jgi:alkylation response protein AidB-like acyl-CoA dehydrogenase